MLCVIGFFFHTTRVSSRGTNRNGRWRGGFKEQKSVLFVESYELEGNSHKMPDFHRRVTDWLPKLFKNL